MAFNRAGHSPALQASRLVEGPGQKPAGQSLLKAGKVYRLSSRAVLKSLRGFSKAQNTEMFTRPWRHLWKRGAMGAQP